MLKKYQLKVKLQIGRQYFTSEINLERSFVLRFWKKL